MVTYAVESERKSGRPFSVQYFNSIEAAVEHLGLPGVACGTIYEGSLAGKIIFTNDPEEVIYEQR